MVYAATSLVINNNATIVTGAPNLFIVTGVSATTSCASTGGYSDTGLTVNWGSVVQGSTATQYICLENTGTPHTLTITNSLPSLDGTLTTTNGGTSATGLTVAHDGFALIALTWAVDPNAPTTTITFTITVS